MVVLSVFLSLVFLILATIHLSWAVGSTWGLESALPSDPAGQKIIRPRPAMTLLVSLGLLVCAFMYFINPEPDNPKNWIFEWGRLIIPILFLLRALGDFRYVGWTKKVKETRFAKMDTKYYTPICLAISLLGLMVRFF